MNNYLIRLADEEDIERIQQLSQELMEHEKDNATKEYMFNMNWALTEQGYNNYKSNVEKEAQRFYQKHGLYKYAIEQYAEIQ